MKKLVLTILIVGLWGTVGGQVVVTIDDTSDSTDPRCYLPERDLTQEDIDSLFIKKCRVDTVGWVAKVCQTYFTWEPSEPDFNTGCSVQSGDAFYAVANRLVWNRKEKPPTMQWIVRTKTTCWYELIDRPK